MAPSPAATRNRLRVAIQKSGRLGQPARDLLAACGLTWRESRDRLFCYGESFPIDLLLVRDDDIPGLIADGVCDLGVVGRNVLREFSADRASDPQASEVSEWRQLGMGRCRLDLAVPTDWTYESPAQFNGTRIATSYPALLGAWLDDNNVDAEVVFLAGSVEIAPRLGQADIICDLVSSGATLAANNLKPVLTILDSEAVIAGPAEPLDGDRAELADMLLRRLDGALQITHSRRLTMLAPRAEVTKILSLLPDGTTPSITPTINPDGSDAQAVAIAQTTSQPVGWPLLEELKDAGAFSIVVATVEGMLA